MADDPKMTESTPVEPVTVTMVGVGSTDTKFLPSGTVAKTPLADQPNVILNVVQPFAAIAIRFINVYIGNLVGLVTAGMTSTAIPAQDFWHLVMKCAGLAIAGAVILSLKDVVTVLGRLESRWPLLTGSV